MIDVGLLLTMIVAMGVPTLIAQRWPLTTFGEPVGFVDAALGPAFAGLAAGRLAAVGIDDARSLGRLSDLLIIRSGVEFWPGVAAAALFAAWVAYRAGVQSSVRLADLTPLAMLGYAGYEATCVVRDGCFGPASSLGLRPPGTSTTMLPIGILAAIVVGAAAVLLRRQQLERTPAMVVVGGGLAAVAALRSVSSIWLPHIGGGLTRQHWTSIAVLLTAAPTLIALSVRSKGRRQVTAIGDDPVRRP